jgi:hypothetical protein
VSRIDPSIARTLRATAALVVAAAALLLVARGARADSIGLTWTAPGDDGAIGRAAAYEIRFSVDPPGTDLAGWWNGAAAVVGVPPPQPAGTRETFSVSGLVTGATYYFVLRTRDEAMNWSDYSNIASRQAGSAGGTLATPAGFTATVVTGGVALSWEEPSTGSGSGYRLYRRLGSDGPDLLLASLSVGATGWSDTSAVGGATYEYRLATYQGTVEGSPAVVSVSVPGDRLASVSAAVRGFPNPARGKVTFRFNGGTKDGAPGRVRLFIYDLTGHLVCQLVDRVLPPGEQAIEWPCRSDHGNAVAPGLYNAILDGPQGRSVARLAIVP